MATSPGLSYNASIGEEIMTEGSYSKEIVLKNAKTVTLRSVSPEDAPALAEFFKSLPEEDRLYLRDDVSDPGFTERFLKRLASHASVPIVAVHEGKIVGQGNLYRESHGWMTHVAQIRLVVSRPFQRTGLGKQMAHELVRMAMQIGVDKVVALVMENQTGARRAFERLGFVQEALLKDHVKDLRGKKHNLCILSNDVSHLWEAMEALAEDYLPSQE
jgi:RimJ/RimL family protein N-acetyltransferase